MLITPNALPIIPFYLRAAPEHERRSPSELRYLQSELNYTWLVWDNGQRVLVSRSLSYLLRRLPADSFVRLHRRYVVNQRFVRGLEGGGNRERVVCLTTGERLPISRRRWTLVRQQLARTGTAGATTKTPARGTQKRGSHRKPKPGNELI